MVLPGRSRWPSTGVPPRRRPASAGRMRLRSYACMALIGARPSVLWATATCLAKSRRSCSTPPARTSTLTGGPELCGRGGGPDRERPLSTRATRLSGCTGNAEGGGRSGNMFGHRKPKRVQIPQHVLSKRRRDRSLGVGLQALILLPEAGVFTALWTCATGRGPSPPTLFALTFMAIPGSVIEVPLFIPVQPAHGARSSPHSHYAREALVAGR